MITEESELQSILVEELKCIYNNPGESEEYSNVEAEKYVNFDADDTDGYAIDVAIEGANIAIECKDNNMKNIKAGVGQAVRYEVDDWSSYLCIPSEVISKEIVDMCLQAGIGLVGVSDVGLHEGNRIDIFIQNDISITSTMSGYVRADNAIDIPKILDILEVDTIDDVIMLNDELSKLKMRSGPEHKWKNIKTDRSILPET